MDPDLIKKKLKNYEAQGWLWCGLRSLDMCEGCEECVDQTDDNEILEPTKNATKIKDVDGSITERFKE